jgi:SAM-dependent methyltransferase
VSSRSATRRAAKAKCCSTACSPAKAACTASRSSPAFRSSFGEHEYIDVKAETRAGSLFQGPSSREVIKLLQSGEWARAFEVLINPPTSKLDLPLIDRLAKVPGVGGLARYARWKSATVAAPHWRRRFLRDLQALGERATAMKVLKLYYDGWYKQELMNYFMYRFAQPRHLVALSLASVLTQHRGAVLDVACGVGHLTHYLSSPPHSLPVVGLDRNFFQLYIARNYVAPSADFICCPADGPLPFATEAFGGVLCSDAFHYFLEKQRCADELQRIVAADGSIVITRVGNLAVKPNEGYELLPAGLPAAVRAAGAGYGDRGNDPAAVSAPARPRPERVSAGRRIAAGQVAELRRDQGSARVA